MTRSDRFTLVLRKWAETFTRRSMVESMRFKQESGLSMTQMHTLFQLHHCETCGVTEIGEFLGITNAAASQLVDRLVQSNLVTRNEDPTDRRAKQISLTDEGKEFVARGIDSRRKWMEQLTFELSIDEQELITDALTILTAAADKTGPDFD
jgi:DNA-binding MarR family transcriptional regulator